MEKRLPLGIQKAAIYVRVSTEEQAKHGFSLSAQEDALKNYAKSLGYEIYKIYKDEGKSAKDIKHRPELKELLKDAEQKQFSAIFVYKLDRFSRSLKDLILTIEKLKEQGIDFISLQDRIETASASGKLMFHIISAFAEFERDIIGERTRFGMIEKAKGGGTVSKAPLGYKMENGKLIIDIQKKEIVEKIFETFLNTKISLTQLAKSFNITTRGLTKLLKNRTYLGEIKFKENYKGNHKKIISEELFDKVGQKINDLSLQRNLIMNYNFLDRSLVQGDSRYYDPHLLQLISFFITKEAVNIEERQIGKVQEPKEEDIKKIEGPQKYAKYIMKLLLKQEGFTDTEIFTEINYGDNRPDLSALNEKKEVFVECFSCKLKKVLDYLAQKKELWVLVKGAYPWDKTPIQEPIQWLVFRKGPNWNSIYSSYKNNQLEKLKNIKNPLD